VKAPTGRHSGAGRGPAPSPIRLVLASASPRRLDLLARVDVIPDAVLPADIDESVSKGELPRVHALRLAEEKARAVAALQPDALVLAADTVVAVGRRILPKVEDEATLRRCMDLLSGRRHRVLTGVALALPGGLLRSRVVETAITMKRLSAEEIDHYARRGEWRGKAGGYALQGYGEVYVRHIAGSYSNVVGLPLAETRHLLKSAGYPLA
jgi:septum formation protein